MCVCIGEVFPPLLSVLVVLERGGRGEKMRVEQLVGTGGIFSVCVFGGGYFCCCFLVDEEYP